MPQTYGFFLQLSGLSDSDIEKVLNSILENKSDVVAAKLIIADAKERRSVYG